MVERFSPAALISQGVSYRWLKPLLALLLSVGFAVPLLHLGAAQGRDGRQTSPGTGLSKPPAMAPRPERRRDLYSRLEPIPAALATAPRIRLGVHLENAYNLSIPDQTFMAEGWYWLEWPEALQQRMGSEKINSDTMVEFVNNIIGKDFRVSPDNPEPVRKADGSFYQLFRFSGSFYIDDLNLRRSPFNELSLPLLFETRPVSFATDGGEPLLLMPVSNQEGLIGSYASIKGYKQVGVNIQPLIHSYPTDFGDGSAYDFAMTEMRVYYRTTWFPPLLKWVLPLLIVMAVVFLAPSLEGSLGELRLAIPSTALLTLVVMQQTYQTELPSLPYLTFLDILYGYCYFVSIALFVLFLWGTNVHASQANPTPAVAAAIRTRLDKADQRFQLISLIGMAAVMLIGLLH
jgi:hypothetical protein